MKWENTIILISIALAMLLFINCARENPTQSSPNNTLNNKSKKCSINGRVYEIAYIWDEFYYKYKFDTLGIENLSIKMDTLLTKTDQEGYYQFSNIDSGEYKISITDTFYFPIDTLVQIISDTLMNFRLLPITERYFPLSVGNEWKYDYKCWMRGIHCPDKKISGITTWQIIETDSLENKVNYNSLCLFSGNEIIKSSSNKYDTLSVQDTLYFNILKDYDRLYFQVDDYNQKNKLYLWSLMHELYIFSLYTIVKTYYPLYFDDNITLYFQFDYELRIKKGEGITYFKKIGGGHTCPTDQNLSLISSSILEP